MSKTIIAVCTGNTCRSPMAEGIIRDILTKKGEDVIVKSVGISAFAGDIVSANSTEALALIGIDISDHVAHVANINEFINAYKIYAMTETHKTAIINAVPELSAKIVVLNVSDPYGQDIEQYIKCRNQMLEFFKGEFDDNNTND